MSSQLSIARSSIAIVQVRKQVLQLAPSGRHSRSIVRGRGSRTPAAGLDSGESLSSVPPARVALIGIDCATQPNTVGFAFGELDGEPVRFKVCRTASPKERPEEIVDALLQESGRALLALDAPMGCPVELQRALAGHQAGAVMAASAHARFRTVFHVPDAVPSLAGLITTSRHQRRIEGFLAQSATA